MTKGIRFEGLLIALLLAVATAALSACETPANKRAPAEESAPAEPAATSLDTAALVAEAQRLRDREFSRAPDFVAVPPAEALAPALAPPSAVAADRAAILRGLFGWDASAWPADATDPLEALAAWDHDAHAVRYREGRDAASDDRLRQAVLAALVTGLDATHLPAPDAPSTWDEALALEAMRRGPASLVAAAHAAQQKAGGDAGIDVDLATVARRPDLVARLDSFAPALEAEAARGAVDPAVVARRAEAFTLREGLVLAAAMHRASGWSGVEYLREDPPRSTAWIVRPDRWLRGESLGQWSWPAATTEARGEAGYTLERDGRIGPAILALWLGRHVDPRIARTLYLGWQSDAYRMWREGESGPWLFEWVSFWDTPHNAQQVLEAMEAGLRRQDGGDARYHVLRKGATVAVVGTSDPARAAAAAAGLDQTADLVGMTPRFAAQDPGLLGFVPTPGDRLIAGAAEAVLDDEGMRWEDPAMALKADLSPLSGWTLQKTDEPTLRWFARHPVDDALVQMTTELVDPFAPAYATDAYAERVRGAFASSLGVGHPDEKPDEKADETTGGKLERLQRAFGPAIALEMRGRLQGEPTTILAWQFPVAGEALVTFSLQGAPEAVERHRDAARRVFESITVEASVESGAEAAGDGILKFEVEGE